jgi:hypothetical protein
MGARAVRGRYGCSDGGSDTWDIEIPAFDKASLYQTREFFHPSGTNRRRITLEKSTFKE